MKVVTIVGARPQFVKAAIISRAFTQMADVNEVMVHTGQHYDENMSEIFFEEMNIPRPAYQLKAGGGNHGAMTGRMLAGIEKILLDEDPDCVLVFGDTNSTLSGALASAKLHIPVAHIEAGLRSFNRNMPEEINRVLTDHLSKLLFCPTVRAVENLGREAIDKGVYHVGDVMYDAALLFGKVAEKGSGIIKRLNLDGKTFCLATIHREENTEDPARLQTIVESLGAIANPLSQVILPLHPRTLKYLKKYGLLTFSSGNKYFRFIEPVSFLDMVALEKKAKIIITDSGGVQKEAYFHCVPCVTIRDETEWVETIECGWNTLVSANKERIISAVEMAPAKDRRPIKDYGEGCSAQKIVKIISSGNW